MEEGALPRCECEMAQRAWLRYVCDPHAESLQPCELRNREEKQVVRQIDPIVLNLNAGAQKGRRQTGERSFLILSNVGVGCIARSTSSTTSGTNVILMVCIEKGDAGMFELVRESWEQDLRSGFASPWRRARP
jgi:hypothetical protein